METRLVGNSFAVAGGPETVDDVLRLLGEEGVKTQGNPDMYVRTYKHFGIDEARELISRASLRATGARRVFVVVAPDVNRETQNALLKTIEEPPGGALFFLVVPSPETLLPTLRSRLQILSLSPSENGKDAVSAKQFLSALPERRLKLLEPLLEKGEDDKRDLGKIIEFLSALERQLEKSPEGLRAVYRARKYVADKGALAKPLLEQVALLTPKV